MERIERQVFRNEVVELDGIHFVDCTFLGCIFEYYGGAVAFERPVMRGCCHVFYGGGGLTDHPLQDAGVLPLDPFAWTTVSETVH